MGNNPSVSVCVTTYFHEKTISQALNSILAQIVDFDYEICISDDASKDGTINILKDFSSKHKNIRLNINETNIGLTRNFERLYKMAKGKYIVILSGDDYYIDNLKLQKQYDFLENNKSSFLSGVATSIESRYDDEELAQKTYPLKRLRNKPFTLKMFMSGYNCPLNGIMVRNFWIDANEQKDMETMVKASDYIDDITLSILYLKKGDVFILPDICTAYRIHRTNKGNHNFNSLNKGLLNFKKHIDNLNYLDGFFLDLDFYKRYKMVTKMGIKASIKTKSHKEFKNIYNTIPLRYRRKGLLFNSIVSLVPEFFKRLFSH